MNYEVNKKYTQDLAVEVELEKPSRYQVIMHNDDFTPMEFVVTILEKYFYMDRGMAAQLMLAAHQSGKAVCGVFTKDVAESKIAQVMDYARVHEHPLSFSMEAA